MKKYLIMGSLLTLLTVSFLVFAKGTGFDTKRNPDCENCKVDNTVKSVSTN